LASNKEALMAESRDRNMGDAPTKRNDDLGVGINEEDIIGRASEEDDEEFEETDDLDEDEDLEESDR
jgi:hypothetical protein